jgi:acetyl-CoA carboxylase biotin carboxyl carrier protein
MAHTIKSQVTGNVWKVTIVAGAQVEAGDQLCIMESMKMEIPVLADVSGTVKKIHVSEGDSINEGAVVMTLDT